MHIPLNYEPGLASNAIRLSQRNPIDPTNAIQELKLGNFRYREGNGIGVGASIVGGILQFVFTCLMLEKLMAEGKSEVYK